MTKTDDVTLAERIEARAIEPGPRVERIEDNGRVFWIKRPEVLSLRMRLQKGDPVRAFAEEVAAHVAFAEQGLPVAPVVLATEAVLVTEDCGPQLKHLARAGAAGFPDGLAAAAKALAEMHLAGHAHGRPSLKDICWRDGRIAFLDLERAGRTKNLARAQSFDVLVLIFSTAVETGGNLSAMTLARDAYRDAGGAETLERAQTRARRFAPLAWLLRPIFRALRGNREFDAVAPFFAFMVQAD